MQRAYVAFGANLAEPERQLRQAAAKLIALPQVSDFVGSSLYRSAPIGGPEQSDYLNAVASLCWDGDAEQLLDALLAIEAEAGRIRRAGQRNHPRTLDMDLLLFGDAQLALPQLQIPHPRMGERAFVLVPLAEISPDLQIPGLGSLQQLLPAVADQGLAPIDGARLGEALTDAS